MYRKNFEAAFWAKVRKGSGCWLWIGARKSNGYGNYSKGRPSRKTLLAHRVAWMLTRGHIPKGILVLHRCDNRLCMKHLFLGTPKDNMQDMIQKGRQRNTCKLTVVQVRKIRALVASGTSRCQAAREYGLSPEMVCRIVDRRAWKTA